jgi:threonine aldolase
MKKTFASDNYSGVHPEVMEALVNANRGHQPSYGADEFTISATRHFKKLFGENTELFFVYNGTGANVLGLKAITQSFHSILCSELAHINVDESTAPETFTGCKVIPVQQKHGKIDPTEVEKKIVRIGDQHHPQPKVISISQTTEYATVYTIEEIKSLADLAHRYNMYLHMDGSRISNAAESLQKSFREFTFDAGVDVLSFGGTKNGLMFGEAVVFAKPEIAPYFQFFRKQGMHLHSKMRFISAQFNALLENELWRKNARHANAMAQRLAKGLKEIKQIRISQPVEANGVFAIFPEEIIRELQEEMFFYVWNDKTSEVRLMCSFDTTQDEVDLFLRKIEEVFARNAG